MKKHILKMAALLVTITLTVAGCNRGSTNADSTGGKPWINSDIQANIKNAKQPAVQDDFHLHVNYEWLKKGKIPKGESRYDSFHEAAKDIDAKALALLKDDTVPGHDAEQVRALYHAFLDWNARNALGVEPVRPTIQDITAIKTLDELSDFICDPERSRWAPTFVEIGNETGSSYTTVTVIGTTNLSLGDSAEYQKRTELGERREKAMFLVFENVASRLGYSKEEIQSLFDTMLSVETKMAAKSFSNAEIMSPDITAKTNNKYTPETIATLTTRFPLVRFIKSWGYSDAKEFIVYQPELIKALDEFYTEENLEDMKAFLLARCIRGFAPYLDKKADKATIEGSDIVSGAQGSLPDDERASNLVRSMLPTPMARAYLARYDMSKVKQDITEICKKVIATYREMLDKEDWLSEETQAKAIEKLDAITIHAVYPEKWIDSSSLNLKGLSYVECINAINDLARKLNRERTNSTMDKDIWAIEDLLQTNAIYRPTDNSINIILGLLATPFYYDSMSQEALLGTIGSVIGHEISHAFDTRGAQFDKNGKLENWWTEQDYKAFQERAAKLIAYYDNITTWNGTQIHGKTIQTEAIADMAGIKVMLTLAKEIPNFDYKEFFTTYAGNWRIVTTREFEQMLIQTDPHPLNYLRTNVTLQQYDEFMEAFDIHEGDGMYLAPKDRILVW